jgi:NAD+ synthase
MAVDTSTDYAALADQIARWLRSQMDASGASRLVVGLSGGIDSAVVCALSTMAAGPARVIAALMPIHSNPVDLHDAHLVASTFEVTPRVIELAPAYDVLVASMPEDGAAGLEDADVDASVQDQRRLLALANLKPRLRMATLYFLANRYGGIVVGTGNKTELSIGYFTKYGDGGVDLLPLGDLDKTTVRGLAHALGVPEAVIVKPPSAGLWQGQTDESEIGVTYEELDHALAVLAGSDGAGAELTPATRERVTELMRGSEHKRRSAPIFRRDALQ